jgi:hypothetical protein
MLPYGHGAVANVTLAGKFNAFFRGLDTDWGSGQQRGLYGNNGGKSAQERDFLIE